MKQLEWVGGRNNIYIFFGFFFKKVAMSIKTLNLCWDEILVYDRLFVFETEPSYNAKALLELVNSDKLPLT